jgi:hypothetical protein
MATQVSRFARARWVLIAVSAALAIGAAIPLWRWLDPRNVVIPTDARQWDLKLGPVLQKLGEADRKIVARYLLEERVRLLFPGRWFSPREGVTVRDVLRMARALSGEKDVPVLARPSTAAFTYEDHAGGRISGISGGGHTARAGEEWTVEWTYLIRPKAADHSAEFIAAADDHRQVRLQPTAMLFEDGSKLTLRALAAVKANPEDTH